jgi:spore coat polysaccharide biosynthesis protein SpsF (cytidylyltransferase family)
MLFRQIERIKKSKYGENFIILTSNLEEDDIIEKIAISTNVKIFRGDLLNVANRFLLCLDLHSCDFFVRITGDCPLISPKTMDRVIDFAIEKNTDYCSNNLIPTYPDGLDVEVIKVESFRRLMNYDLSVFEKEHVTYGMYTRVNEFECINYPNDIDLSSMRWTVDTQDDFDFITTVYNNLYDKIKIFELEDVLDLINNNKIQNRTIKDYPRNKAIIDYNSEGQLNEF